MDLLKSMFGPSRPYGKVPDKDQASSLPVSTGVSSNGSTSRPRGDPPDRPPTRGEAESPTPGGGGGGLHGGGDEKSSTLSALGNIFISFVGAGVLGLPYAFKRSGVVLGASVLLVVSMLALYCMMLLVRCRHRLADRNVASYSDVALHSLGPGGKRLVDVLLIISQTGFCVAYFIFISENLANLTGVHAFWWIALCAPFQVGLSFMRTLSALAPFSLAADVANVLGMLVVLKDDFGNFSHHEHTVSFTSLRNLPFLFGVVLYCFEGIGMILPIEASMEAPEDFPFVLCLGVFSITFIYIMFGMVGYVAFGNLTQDIITLNLPPDWSTTCVKLSLCLGLFFTFPVMMHPVYDIIERGLMATKSFLRNVMPKARWNVFRSLRSCVVLSVALVAMIVPSFGVFISLIGSLCCAMLAFVIPAACHYYLFAEASPLSKAADLALMAFGVIGAALGTGDAVHGLLAGTHTVL